MKITKKRIRSLGPYLKGIKPGTPVVVGLTDPAGHEERLRQIGFSYPLDVGESLLPPPVGPVTSFNADGGEVVHRDQPKEQATQQREWTWYEWRGPYDRVERSRIVDIPYMRYPRTPIPPPAHELTAAVNKEGEPIIVGPEFTYTTENEKALIHGINVFLELFGECDSLDASYGPLIGVNLRKLNWRVLPPGVMPWEQLAPQLAPVINRMSEGNRSPAWHRTAFLNNLGATSHAVGQGGFAGYIVFGFPEKNLYLFESLYYGNATYVVGEDWERLSQMTKAEILAGSLHRDRIIHNEGWPLRVEAAVASA